MKARQDRMRCSTVPTHDISPQHPLPIDIRVEESAQARKYWEDAANSEGSSMLAFTCWGMQLCAIDIRSLHHGIWVNDNIMNCFSRFLMASFDAVIIPTVEAKIGISAKRTTPVNEGKLNVNNAGFIFVPMCDGVHWRVGIAAALTKTVYLYDPQGVKRCNERIMDRLMLWLQTVVAKSPPENNFFESIPEWRLAQVENWPVQKNKDVCGPYVLFAMMAMLEQADPVIPFTKLLNLRPKILLSLIPEDATFLIQKACRRRRFRNPGHCT